MISWNGGGVRLADISINFHRYGFRAGVGNNRYRRRASAQTGQKTDSEYVGKNSFHMANAEITGRTLAQNEADGA